MNKSLLFLLSTSHPWSASFMALDYDGIWSSSIPKLSFLINGHVLGKCFRWCLSWTNPWISPLTIQYKYPQPFLFIIIQKNHIHTLVLSNLFLLSHAFLFNHFYNLFTSYKNYLKHSNLFKVNSLCPHISLAKNIHTQPLFFLSGSKLKKECQRPASWIIFFFLFFFFFSFSLPRPLSLPTTSVLTATTFV